MKLLDYNKLLLKELMKEREKHNKNQIKVLI